ncbi:MAG: SPOR domain-containing protein, partial [Bacteroidota bacterium]
MKAKLTNLLIILFLFLLMWVAFKSLAFLSNRKNTLTAMGTKEQAIEKPIPSTDQTPISDGEKVIQALKGEESSPAKHHSLDHETSQDQTEILPREKSGSKKIVSAPSVDEQNGVAQNTIEARVRKAAPRKSPATKQKKSPSDHSASLKKSPPSDPTTFMLIAGSYSILKNAQKEVDRFRKLGFRKTEMVQFEGRAYHSICIDRFVSKEAAQKSLA